LSTVVKHNPGLTSFCLLYRVSRESNHGNVDAFAEIGATVAGQMEKSLTVKSELSEIEKVRIFLKETLRDFNLSDEAFYLIELSLLEMCINIVRYAYAGEKGDIFLKIWDQEKQLFFEIRDWGIPFDPREAKEPDIHEMVNQGQTGGLGIFLCRQLMNGFEYRRENNQNILIMHKTIEEIEASSSI
jgi:anti-sigma regulatory factor (Ser/Thr protein kinase)